MTIRTYQDHRMCLRVLLTASAMNIYYTRTHTSVAADVECAVKMGASSAQVCGSKLAVGLNQQCMAT